MLDALFNPKSVAVIGASNNPLSIGHIVLQNLVEQGFKGPIYPVNPKSPEVLGIKAYKSVLEIPGDVDLVNISIKNTIVPLALEDCGKKGVKFAIVHSAGFKETGAEGAELEKHIVAIAHKHGMRIYGPNSQGIENSAPEARVYANFTFTPFTPGNISIIAQSGGVGEVFQLQLGKLGAGFHMYASYGNESDVSLNEILAHYGADEGTKVILLHIESLKDAAGFLETACEVSKTTPILAVKSGRTKQGLKAVSSHTGALMEKDVTTDVIFERAGILRFTTQEEMIQSAIALSCQPAAKGKRVAMITNTGGPAILAVDEIVMAGLELAELTPETDDFLRKTLYPAAAVGNPVDILATATPEHYDAAIGALMEDSNVDSVLINFITAQFVDLNAIAATLAAWGKKATKPLILVVMTIPKWQPLIDTVRAGGVPVYEFPETGARALVTMTRYGQALQAPAPVYPELEIDRDAAAQVFADCAEGYITQAQAFCALAAYGIPATTTRRVKDRAGIETAAKELTFPLVLKVDSADVVHKTDAGGLVLDIENEFSLIEAYETMSSRFPGAPFVVQQQLEAAIETIIGVNNTEEVGPIIMFGLGGILVEAIKDVQFRLAPLSRQNAEDMVRRIKGYSILEGVRGKLGADIESLIDILLRVSRLATDFPRIQEMDLNPVFSFGPGAGSKVVDVRIKLAEEESN